MTRTLLIVDDIKSNREILKYMLGGDYSILEAQHGQEALAVMTREYEKISAVLLDLGMPVMDGYEVLTYMQGNEKLSQLPVIVTTGQTDAGSEERALRLGARDYISKPYKSAIIRQRIWNTINLRETAATVNALQRDRLTGLYSRDAFFEKVQKMVSEQEPGYYTMACFDVDKFKIINDQYGTAKGDAVLRHIAGVFKEGFEPAGGVCCRVSADDFAVLYPTAFQQTEQIAGIRKQAGNIAGLASPLAFSIGRYVVSDVTMAPSAMYDRAMLAADSAKGRYDIQAAVYDESMRDKLLHEQEIVNEMEGALGAGQFEVWYQPQYNHSSGAMIGAEALVRWRHPERGLIAPGIFVPVFEQNGFIYSLDKYVWESVCRYIRSELDAGRAPLPVSVNISRYDVFRDDLVENITALIAKYAVPVEMLRFEITESAFAEDTEHIVAVVKELVELGFTLEIDDFGSGYSSLNTLKCVPAQVVKLDMRFLEDADGSERGGNIIESIVRMTKWLGMSVIAEGVEKREQADYLRSIGCNYVQGYLYARPMPEAQYRRLCIEAGCGEKLLALEAVENLDNNSFWNPESMDTLIFNSYVGAACVYEYHNGRLELLRVSKNYVSMLGSVGMSAEDALRLNWIEHLDEQNRDKLAKGLARSREAKRDITDEYVFTDLPGCPHETYLRSTMRVIAIAGERCLVYCTSENVTAQRSAEQRERETAEQLRTMMDDMPGGFCRLSVAPDGSVKPAYINDGFCRLTGMYSDEAMRLYSNDVMAGVHPDDVPMVRRVFSKMMADGEACSLRFRLMHGSGGYMWLSIFGRLSLDASGSIFLNVYFTDVTAQVREEEKQKELLDNLPYGAALYDYDGQHLSIIHLNKRYWELVDREEAVYSGDEFLNVVHPDDKRIIARELESGIREQRDIFCDIRVLCGREDYRPFHIAGRVLSKKEGGYSIYAAYTPITDEAMSVQQMLPIALSAVMDTQTGYTFVKDKNLRYVCCSREMARIIGLESDADMIGKTDEELFSGVQATEFAAEDRRVIESGEAMIDHVSRLPSADGSDIYSSTSKFPLKDSRGNVIGVYGLGRDITETRNMQTRLELLTNNIPGGIAIYEGRPDALDSIKLTYFSDGFCRLFGYTREEYKALADENPLGLVLPADVAAMHDNVASLARDGVPMDYIYRALVNGGGIKWINVKAVLGEVSGGNMTVNAVFFDVTDHQEALEQLRISEQENRLAVQHTKNAICRFDVATSTVRVPPHSQREFALPELIENVPSGPIENGVISAETAGAYRAFYEGIKSGCKTGEATIQKRSDNGWRWFEGHYSTIFSSDGRPVSAVISFIDITEQLEKDSAYRRWQQSFLNRPPESYSLFRCNISSKASFDTREGSLLSVQFASGVFSFDEHTAEYASQFVSEDDRERFTAFLNADALLSGYYQGKRIVNLEYRELTVGHDFRWLRLTVDLVEHAHSAEIEAYLLFEDIDKAKRQELATIEQAETDPLTGVMNRATFAARVNNIIQTAKPNTQHALMMLDIDGFKQVNDAFGHGAGDQSLVDIANSLRKALRHGDLVGRLGGDEFLIFLTDIPGDIIAATKARQICALTRKSFSAEVEISGSVGIAVTPRDGADFDTLYKRSDSALYHVKGSGKDNYAFYHHDMENEHLSFEPKPPATVGAMVSARSEKKRRMLIVDDSRIDHAMLTNIFAEQFIVEKAKDGNAALIRLRHYGSAISVVLLDLMMPGMDGFAVLKKMQESPELRNVPVIVVSSDDSREAGLRAIREGAVDFVNKPVDPEILRVRVQSAISKAENERLRAKNSFLEYQNSEVVRYRTALEHSGIMVVEHDWVAGTFIYDQTMAEHIAGEFNERSLWHIFLSDLVTDTMTVKKMQDMVLAIATDRRHNSGQMFIQLRTPVKTRRWFRMNVYKVVNEFGLAGRIYMTFVELGREKPVSAEDAAEISNEG